MQSIFVTGFPGFLGSALVGRILDRTDSNITINCLVQSKFRDLANQRILQIEAYSDHRRGRIVLLEGDITRPDLGLGEAWLHLQTETIEIFHLAAIYDLGVSRDVSMAVNVDGTRNMLEFALACPQLTRFHYVSTCYVSGRYDGIFRETDLAVGQAFNNYYEETKYLAEVEVQMAKRSGLPITIYRPGIVVGDSKTGFTQKYDGPYYLIQLVARQLFVAFVPSIGIPTQNTMNIVPQDFVVDAIAYLSAQESSKNKVYQLANPRPPTIDQLITLTEQTLSKPIIRVPVIKDATKLALKYVKPVQWVARVEAETLEYFVHPTVYTSTNTIADLEGTGIVCPPIETYFDTLVAFWRNNRKVSAKAMA